MNVNVPYNRYDDERPSERWSYPYYMGWTSDEWDRAYELYMIAHDGKAPEGSVREMDLQVRWWWIRGFRTKAAPEMQIVLLPPSRKRRE
jgi:hypothetical protein